MCSRVSFVRSWKATQLSGFWTPDRVLCALILKDPCRELIFLEAADQYGNGFHIYLPCLLLLTDCFTCSDQNPGNWCPPWRFLQMSRPLYSLRGTGRLRSCEIATFLACFLHTLRQCWPMRSWLTHTTFTVSGPWVWHTFWVNSHDLAFTHGHLGQSVFASKD